MNWKKRLLTLLTLTLGLLGTALAGCTQPASDPSGSPSASGTPEASPSASAPEASATGEKVDGGTLIMCEPTDISSLNILYETGDEGMTMLKPVYDPLYVVSKDGVRYYLAESHEVSEDGLTITVKLRENLKWHDGVPITTEQSSAAWRAGPGGPAVDDYTFTVTLPSVSASYEATLGNLKLLPKHVYEDTPRAGGRGDQLHQRRGLRPLQGEGVEQGREPGAGAV